MFMANSEAAHQKLASSYLSIPVVTEVQSHYWIARVHQWNLQSGEWAVACISTLSVYTMPASLPSLPSARKVNLALEFQKSYTHGQGSLDSSKYFGGDI